MFGLPLDSWLLIAASTLLGPILVLRFVLVQRRRDAGSTRETET